MDAFTQLATLIPSEAGRPSLVGITGAVAAGKSTAAARLRDALAPRSVAIVSTDGFLMTNAELVELDAWYRKGHPDTYDVDRLAALVSDVRAARPATAPVYSHLAYDRVPGVILAVPVVDVVILEGLHLLHDHFARVRDQLDLAVFLDASETDLEAWYLERLQTLVAEARHEPSSFEFYRNLRDDDVADVARSIWTSVNAPNNAAFVAPTRDSADVVIDQGPDHTVVSIRSRR